MKTKLFGILCAIILIGATTVNAQTKPIPPDRPPNGFHFGIGLEGALPMGDMKDLYKYKVGAGATLRFSQGIAENFDLLLTSGAIGFIPEDLVNKTIDTKASIFIPVKLGARLMLGQTFYLMGEAGVTFTKVYGVTSVNMTTGATTEGFVNGSSFSYAPSLGVRFGGLDFGLRYEGLSDMNGGNAATKSPVNFLGLRIGYDF